MCMLHSGVPGSSLFVCTILGSSSIRDAYRYTGSKLHVTFEVLYTINTTVFTSAQVFLKYPFLISQLHV